MRTTPRSPTQAAQPNHPADAYLSLAVVSLVLPLLLLGIAAPASAQWPKHLIDDDLNGPRSVYAADLNGDDWLDVIVTAPNRWEVLWYEAPSWTRHVIDNALGNAYDACAADMDGDMDLDVVAVGWLADDVVWYEAPAWTKHLIDDGGLDGAYAVSVADMDGDTDLDVVATGEQGGNLVWYEAPSWTKHIIDAALSHPHGLHVADINGDTVPDVVVGDVGADDVFWYEAPAWTKHTIDGDLSGPYSVYVADMNGDDLPDVVATASTANDVVWYEAPSWTKHTIDDYLYRAHDVFVADVDGDLLPDVVATGNSAHNVVWYESPLWTKRTIDDSLLGALGVYVADMDGNGAPDVVAAGATADDVIWYENPLVNPLGNIVCLPDSQEITLADNAGGGIYRDEVVIHYLGGGSGAVFQYSIDVEWDANVVSATTSDFERPDSGPFSAAAVFQVTTLANDRVRIEAALPDTEPGTNGPDDLLKATFAGADCGECEIIPIIDEVRDRDGDLLSGFDGVNGFATVDLDAPAITGVQILRTNLPHTGYVKAGDDLTITADIGDDCGEVDDVTVTADLSVLLALGGLAEPPDSYAAGTATWTRADVALTAPDGDKTVTITGTDLLGNQDTGSNTIYADNTKPASLTGLDAAPGHNKVELAWTIPAGDPDLDNYGIMIRRTDWDGNSPPGQEDYPEYTGTEPDYPDSNQGIQIHWAVGMISSYTDAFAVDGSERDICYYQTFVFDKAHNYSLPDAGARDRATNYWLGDVAPPGTYDGYVTTPDISVLSASYYGHLLTPPSYDTECDVAQAAAPQDPLGIPAPDMQVDFEDLMIFALNYENVSPVYLPAAVSVDSEVGDVALYLQLPDELAVGSEFTAAVMLKDESGLVQGTHFRVAYFPGVLEFVRASEGALVSGCDAVFFKALEVEDLPDVSAAVLGSGITFGHSGELARLTFRIVGEGDIRLELQDVSARNVLNEELLTYSSDVLVGGGGTEVMIPTRVYLRGNQPNPFADATTIAFGLPQEGLVRLAIYDVSGRMVRMLINGTLPAAEHVLSWDRRDDSGHAVSGGVYLYRLESSEKTITRKMVISN